MEGFFKEKKEGEGLLGKSAPFFFLSTGSRGGEQEGAAPLGCSPPGHGGGRGGGENGEESVGIGFPCSPRARAASGGRAARTSGGGRGSSGRRHYAA